MSIQISLTKSHIIFSLLHGLTIAFLCNFLAIHIFEDITKEIYWTTGGFFVGAASGILILNGTLKALKTLIARNVALAVLIAFELALGLMLVIPYIFVSLYFEYPPMNHSICCETPINYGAKGFESVQISRPDGANISGWYVAPTIQKDNVVILLHGADNNRHATDWHAQQLIGAGYGVLMYDLRGHGESYGKLTMFNDVESHTGDLMAAVDFLNNNAGIKRNHMAVLGLSLGAYITFNLNTRDLNQFAALWMDGLRGENFRAEPIPNTISEYAMNILMTPLNPIGELYSGEKAPKSLPRFTDIIPNITKPKLMLVASGLDIEENAINKSFVPLIKDNKQIWFIENSWHIGGLLVAEDEYRNRMLAFFDAAFAEH